MWLMRRRRDDGGALWLLLALGAAVLVRGRFRRASHDLDGSTALITGGSRGLGLILARELARRGCRVVICARDGEELERARLHLAARGADVLALRCDVADQGEV